MHHGDVGEHSADESDQGRDLRACETYGRTAVGLGLGVKVSPICLRAQSWPATEDEPDNDREDGIEDERGEEQGQRRRGEAVLRQIVVDEDAVDADGRERAGQGTVDDEQTDHELIDPMSARERQRQRRDDGHSEERPERDEDSCQCEEDPGHESDAPADELHAPADDHFDRAVVLSEAEEIGQADEREEEVDGKACEELFGCLVQDEAADAGGCDEAEQAHIDVPPGSDDEHQAEDDYADQFCTHGFSFSFERQPRNVRRHKGMRLKLMHVTWCDQVHSAYELTVTFSGRTQSPIRRFV